MGLPALQPDPSILDQLQQVYQLKGQMNNQQLQTQQLQAAKLGNQQTMTAIERDAALHKAMADAGGDPTKALPEIMKIDPETGLKIQKQIVDWQNATIDQKKKILDTQETQLKRLGQLAGGVTDQTSYQLALQQAGQEGLLPSDQLQYYAQQPYSPDLIKQIQQKTLTAKEQIDTGREALTAAETARHNQAEEGKLPEEERNFQAFYKAFLGANNAQPNAKLEMQARTEFARRKQNPATIVNASNARADRSYQFSSNQLEKTAKPIEDAISRFSRLKDTLDQNSPQADALVAPELLTVMAGGQGSGLRMNEAEISRIVGGRNKWQDLQAAIQKWQLDPSKPFAITPEQRGQIRSLMNEVYGKLQAKQKVLDQAREDLVAADDPGKHRQILANIHKQLSAVDQAASNNQPSGPPPGATHTAMGSDGKKHYTNDKGEDLGIVP